MKEIRPGNILEGPYWPEKVKAISVKQIGDNQVRIEAVGIELQPQRYYNPVLPTKKLDKIKITEEKSFTFSADGESLFLFLESHRIRNAFQFDPMLAVNVSQIDPLPHQIEAVYHHIMRNPRIRFMLADDPGAGKTIMAGLLIKELKYRGLVDRTLIVAPGHLRDQWVREMKEKFQENFSAVDRNIMEAHWGQNVFQERNQMVTSMDFIARNDKAISALRDSRWDLCIVDEAHKMSAYKYGQKIDKTLRYNVGELLSPLTHYFLFLTATPHRGDPENFRLLLDLLEPGFFANTKMLSESIQKKDNPLFLRRLKEDLKDFDKAPLFPPRKVETMKYYLSEDEKLLYNAVTEYVEKHFNKALEKEKRNVTFALTILQRRLASSVRAIRKSLERRHNRLKDLYEKGQILKDQDISYEEYYIDDLDERERWRKEEELLEKLTSAESLEELKVEIDKLDELVKLARDVEKKEIETKLIELRKLMDSEQVKKEHAKLLIFTEAKDTMEYLGEKLKKWGFSVTHIHGGMNLDSRIQAENEFNNGPTQIMVSTEAGGEGINLQKRCWMMVNYDIPWNPNRLEQRMGRIHRYGQQHEVHIYNLVAVETKEGKILKRLFEKLEKIQEDIRSDRVFDVIGEVLVGKSLKDLIIDAIANRRTMEDILKDFERIPDEEAVQKVKEASMEALATRHIDLGKILGEQRRAKENRLVPEYVEEFFQRAAKALKIKMEKRKDGFWRISSIPFEIRNQPNRFKIKYGEVFREYLKVSFDKEKAKNGQAEFVAMGHPLLEATVETILKRLDKESQEGATFTEAEGIHEGTIWFLEAEIRDGKDEVAGKRLFAIHQNMKGELSFINPAILWDLKPATKSGNHGDELDRDTIVAFAITEGLETYTQELLERRSHDAEIKQKYGIHSLDMMILDSDAKIADYQTRKMKGENIPEPVILKETQNKESLEQKKERLQKEIEAETHLYPKEPRLLGAVRIIPATENARKAGMAPDKEIELMGMKVVMEYERKHGRQPENVSLLNLGYDIKSKNDKEEYRYIEVKARAKEGAIALTPNEWLMAHRLGVEYWLYVVENAGTKPELYIMRDPASNLSPKKEINVVRYIVNDWKPKAEATK